MRRIVLFTIATLVAASCGSGTSTSGDRVGGPCAIDTDCEERCERGSDYPQGMCTLSCQSDDDCPDGAHCVEHDGRLCLLACDVPADCRGGYTCRGLKNPGTGGDSTVCAH